MAFKTLTEENGSNERIKPWRWTGKCGSALGAGRMGGKTQLFEKLEKSRVKIP